MGSGILPVLTTPLYLPALWQGSAWLVGRNAPRAWYSALKPQQFPAGFWNGELGSFGHACIAAVVGDYFLQV